MPVKVKNLTPRFLLLPLNSGVTLRLSPGEVSKELNDAEIMENSKVSKLLDLRSIVVEPLAKEGAKSAKAPKA